MQTTIRSYSQEALTQYLVSLGYPKFRGKQLFQWLYQKHCTSYEQMSNLPKDLREKLARELPFTPEVIYDKRISKDGTRKYIIRFCDGALAETVAIPAEDRLTVCFSTQVGCAMACSFCATGTEGLTRNLLPGEMAAQVMIVEEDTGQRVTNVVGMGQGEPFQNYDNVIDGLHIMNSVDGLGIGARHITISSCGIIQGIERWMEEPEQFTLAISLHSAVQETRDMLMPRVKNQPLDLLKQAIQTYTEKTNRRVTFEYIMINGVNDTPKHLSALVEYCSGLLCHVNLIPINATDGEQFQPSNERVMKQFVTRLRESGTEATVRLSKGADIDGACGQLKNKIVNG